MRVIFCGTAAFALPSLDALALNHEIALVITQEDRQAGRGRKLNMSPVKKAAAELNLAIKQPRSLHVKSLVGELRAVQADVLIVAAYGKIIPPAILNIFPHGCLNVHASLLPRHRGAAPVAAAILAGDSDTGVTIMQMDEGLDTGPILRQRSLSLSGTETTAALTIALAQLGSALLLPTLIDWVEGCINPQVQEESKATYASLLRKDDAIVEWNQEATVICRHVRAMQPWPGAISFWNGRQLKIYSARSVPETVEGAPGTVVKYHKDLAVIAGTGIVVLEELQIAGKRAMTAADFLRGYGGIIGTVL